MTTESPDGIILEKIGPDDLKDITQLAVDEFVKGEPPVRVFNSHLCRVIGLQPLTYKILDMVATH